MKHFSAALADLCDAIHTTPQVIAHGFDLLIGLDEFLEGTRDGADAAFDACGKESGKDFEKTKRELEALVGGPVGRVDLFLHSRAMEFPVGKAVDRKDVAVLLVEPATKFRQR